MYRSLLFSAIPFSQVFYFFYPTLGIATRKKEASKNSKAETHTIAKRMKKSSKVYGL